MDLSFRDIVNRKSNLFDEFIGACVISSSIAHSAHLATKSYEKHMAYEYFYDEMPDKIDAFAETYMASGYSYIPMLKIPNVSFDMFIKQLAAMAEEVSKTAPNGVLKNTADEIQQVCLQTLYKLSLS